jgi:hypothetical protein
MDDPIGRILEKYRRKLEKEIDLKWKKLQEEEE